MPCEEAEQQAEASGDVPPPPRQIVISILFCLFLFCLYLYLLSAPSLSSPFPHSLASPPSLLSIFCPPKIKTSTFIQLIYLVKRH